MEIVNPFKVVNVNTTLMVGITTERKLSRFSRQMHDGIESRQWRGKFCLSVSLFLFLRDLHVHQTRIRKINKDPRPPPHRRFEFN